MENSLEKCVCCGIDTEYEFRQSIDSRERYVDGAGQLCLECYNEIYNKKITHSKHKQVNKNTENVF